MLKFSISDRHILLRKLTTEQFDVLVIGGGITGAGIALDAASRGLKTALIEKKDFAFGTSSRSTKLIHGGLRYLKQLEFGLVKEVGSERAIVHRLAPHLVIPEKMLLPLSEKKGLGYWLTSIGLRIYDYLAGVQPRDQRRMLTKKNTLRYEPMLKPDDIRGGAIYAEYRTDDARLTIEIIKTAFDHGATIVNYAEVNDFIYDNNTVVGVLAEDQVTRETLTIRAKVVVSAAGPWVDTLREVNRSKSGKRLHLTKGVHIVFAKEKLPVRQSIYFDVDDGRMIFAIPRGNITYVGTTDTNFAGTPDNVAASRDDAEYLVKAVNATFPGVKLTVSDIQSSWAGLRPLIHEEGKSASQLSRKDEIFESPSGLISIAGGKLTGYRKMAERVVNLIIKKKISDRKFPKCFTDKISLSGAEFKTRKSLRSYLAKIQGTLEKLDLDQSTAKHLVHSFGKQTDTIIQLYDNMLDASSPEEKILKAQLLFCINHEMVISLSDFFIRRTGLLYFEIAKVIRHRKAIGIYMKELMKWDDKKLLQEMEELESAIRQATAFA
jgi:glycerol-3-phosphate dehydrogenase